MCLGVAVVTLIIDGVEQPKEGIRCKPFVYSGKMLLSMTNFEKKFQNEIAPVKGLKEVHTTGWFVFIVRKEHKLYLEIPITKFVDPNSW